MLPNAAIILTLDSREHVAICVSNFPTLPSMARVSVNYGGEDLFNDGTIETYEVGNEFGIEIRVTLCGNESEQLKTWKRLVQRCVKDPNGLCTYIFPHRIDFAVRLKLPSES